MYMEDGATKDCMVRTFEVDHPEVQRCEAEVVLYAEDDVENNASQLKKFSILCLHHFLCYLIHVFQTPTHVSFPVISIPEFCCCIPFSFMCFVYFCVFSIMCSK